MRHRLGGNRLNRHQSLRKATIRDIAKAALIQERICTTKTKAKEARKLIDRLITLGKRGTLACKRRAYAILCDHGLVSTLFTETAPRFKNRIGGYTRIINLGIRRGDNAQLALLELTEKKEIVVTKPKSTAAAKKEDLKPVEPKTLEKETVKEPSKEPKEHIKEQPKKEFKKPPVKVPGKLGKGFVSGIRQMFQKKSPGEK